MRFAAVGEVAKTAFQIRRHFPLGRHPPGRGWPPGCRGDGSPIAVTTVHSSHAANLQPPIAYIGRDGGRNDSSSIPCDRFFAATQDFAFCTIASSEHPSRSNMRSGVSS